MIYFKRRRSKRRRKEKMNPFKFMNDEETISLESMTDEMLSEIFSRLSLNTLSHLKCTNKRFRHLISEPSFIAMQARRSGEDVLGLFHTSIFHGRQVQYLPFDHGSDAHYNPLSECNLPHHTSIVAYSNNNTGLLICYDRTDRSYYVWKPPPINRCLLLPTHPTVDHYRRSPFGLVVDPDPSKPTPLKVVCSHYKINDASGVKIMGFMVFSSETACWRESNAELQCKRGHFLNSSSAVFFNGALHWVTDAGDIVAFHLENEHAWTMRLPETVQISAFGKYANVWFGLAEGLIHLVQFSGNKIVIWVLAEGYENSMWRIKHEVVTDKINDRSSVPVFFDGRHITVASFDEGQGPEFGLYKVYSGRWRTAAWSIWMDSNRQFAPYFSNMIGMHLFSLS